MPFEVLFAFAERSSRRTWPYLVLLCQVRFAVLIAAFSGSGFQLVPMVKKLCQLFQLLCSPNFSQWTERFQLLRWTCDSLPSGFQGYMQSIEDDWPGEQSRRPDCRALRLEVPFARGILEEWVPCRSQELGRSLPSLSWCGFLRQKNALGGWGGGSFGFLTELCSVNWAETDPPPPPRGSLFRPSASPALHPLHRQWLMWFSLWIQILSATVNPVSVYLVHFTPLARFHAQDWLGIFGRGRSLLALP